MRNLFPNWTGSRDAAVHKPLKSDHPAPTFVEQYVYRTLIQLQRTTFIMQTEMPTLKELLARREALQDQLNVARQRQAEIVLAEIVAKMGEYKISLAELMGHNTQVKTSAPVAATTGVPKYRDAVSGATWSGRGRAPHWIVDKNRDEFLVDA
jgi:DNA-binding protein H-NS